jgi:hypothetical protein
MLGLLPLVLLAGVWLYLTAAQFDSIHADAEELCRIIASIQKTTKTNS